MSTITGTSATVDSAEFTLEIPVWVHGKRKWVTGITKKTTFDDLIYALLAQADLLKSSEITHSSSSSTGLTGYAIAECLQLTASSTSNTNDSDSPSLVTQRIIKGRGKVIKAYKTWQFDKLPLTTLHLIPSASPNATTKLRSKIFRRFLSAKTMPASPLPPSISSSQSDSSLTSNTTSNQTQAVSLSRQRSCNDFHENLNIIERQKRLLDYLDEKIHQAESVSSPLHKSRSSYQADASCPTEVTFNDVSRLFSHQIDQQDQLIFASQLCNSIFNMQERIEEKTNVLYAVEQAISNELNHVLHQQHYDTLPSSLSSVSNDMSSSLSNDLLSLKNSIYRSRELSRLQSKEMHDLDLSLREMEILLANKYDELKYLEYETSSAMMSTSTRSITPNYLSQPQQQQQQTYRTNIEESSAYDTLDMASSNNVAFTAIKEADEDSGINSLTSDDSNHHSTLLTHQKLSSQSTQLETLV